MTLIINGVDIGHLVMYDGYKWQRNDIDSDSAGRAMDGTMQRGYITSKTRLDISCHAMSTDDLRGLLELLTSGETLTVDYTDPLLGERVGVAMYTNNLPASYCVRVDGVDYWNDVTFPLIEV